MDEQRGWGTRVRAPLHVSPCPDFPEPDPARRCKAALVLHVRAAAACGCLRTSLFCAQRCLRGCPGEGSGLLRARGGPGRPQQGAVAE